MHSQVRDALICGWFIFFITAEIQKTMFLRIEQGLVL